MLNTAPLKKNFEMYDFSYYCLSALCLKSMKQIIGDVIVMIIRTGEREKSLL